MQNPRNAMQSALVTNEKSSPSLLWSTLSTPQKNHCVQLFRDLLQKQKNLVIGLDTYYDALPEETNRTESFFFGTDKSSAELQHVRVFSSEVRIFRQRSYDDCVFQDQTYQCSAIMTHQTIMENPVTGLKGVYVCKSWLTVEGMHALKQCMIQSANT